MGHPDRPLEAASASSDQPQDTSAIHSTIHQKSHVLLHKLGFLQKVWQALNWMPSWCRWDPDDPPKFSMAMNLLYAFSAAFTVANLYYSHPVLNVIAHDFKVSYQKASEVPTLAQAGYAVGLAFICPLADLFRRRPMILSLVLVTALMWIGLCVTPSFPAFEVLTFLTALTTVTPQIMVPLTGDLAPPHRRATALSIVTAGFLLGIMLARLLSGIVANFTSWRNVYWIAFALQMLIFCSLWLSLPDYPSKNPHGLSYFRIIWSMPKMLFKHPVLMQACLIGLSGAAPFTNYWTTLTFLLSGSPYYYSSLTIGLWALIGIAGICTMPFVGRFMVDRYVPIFSVLVGQTFGMLGAVVGTYTGLLSPAGPGLEAFFLDLGLQISQVANRTAIYTLEPTARNRVNTVYMLGLFIGQIMGTSVGNKLYAEGGWIASGSFSVGMIGFGMLVSVARGPWEEGWIGWHGGWSMLKKDRLSADGKPTTSNLQPSNGPQDEESQRQIQQQSPPKHWVVEEKSTPWDQTNTHSQPNGADLTNMEMALEEMAEQSDDPEKDDDKWLEV